MVIVGGGSFLVIDCIGSPSRKIRVDDKLVNSAFFDIFFFEIFS